jgi:hypothetical protein
MKTGGIIIAILLGVFILILAGVLIYDFLKDPDISPFKKKSKIHYTPDLLPDPTFLSSKPILLNFFEVTLKSGKKEMVARKNIFTIRASNEGGTIIMSPGGVAFTCTESYEKIREKLY